MNLSNKLTVSRIVLAFVLMYFLFARWQGAKYFALVTFLVACVTDYYDGLLARRRKEITDFGKLMDPIADKILVLAAFLAFVELNLIPAWMVVIVITREALITGLRISALSRGKVLEAEEAGKHKTVSQMVAVMAILIFLVLRDVAQFLIFWNSQLQIWFLRVIFYLMLATVGLTLTSGVSFLWRNRKVIL